MYINAEEGKTVFQTYLDRLIGEEGVKTDVNVTIPKEEYYRLFAAIFLAGVGIAVIVIITRSIIKK
jgi:hypothetical protein